ncbi:PIG-L family deacetylase [Aestuariicoccus sp. KMU-90]|uniref:PIG-L family deacetylase n=2 Tax=Thetidibacter halocola TaxID=2827239 RepID=A0A8J7WDT7_9RHOB|nr:PIG-L family deacetylase [Thetidibacter halocola]
MTIVAHQDDDILFMNPDILHSIEAGVANTTVFVTAGDAGAGAAYWLGREFGAKAAYALMAGVSDWIDETVTLDLGGRVVQVASSYLASAPDIRLYFLRLPDGGGDLPEDLAQQLARLDIGDLATVSALDGSATYSRQDLVGALAALMALHEPATLRLPVHDGPTAAAEHTDHRRVSIFAEEALGLHDGGLVSVTRYVHYDSRLMPENLSPEDAARSLEIMQAYAAHDPGTVDATGTLLDVYESWTARQYVAESFTLDTDDDGPPPARPDPAWPGPGAWEFGLMGEDAALFHIGSATGAVMPQAWFVPSLEDAWDSDGDHVYEVTRLAKPSGGGEVLAQALVFRTTAEGVLSFVSGIDLGPGGGGADPGGWTAEDVFYSLAGPDALLFTVDAASGAVAPQPWFTPGPNAWDRDGDHLYEILRFATPLDGGPALAETLVFETMPGGGFVQWTEGLPPVHIIAAAAGMALTAPPDETLVDLGP